MQALGIKNEFDPVSIEAEVIAVEGLTVVVTDRLGLFSIGDRIEIESGSQDLLAEIVSIGDKVATALPFSALTGIKRGAKVVLLRGGDVVAPSAAWLGRIVDAFGRPIDGKGALISGEVPRPLRNSPPSAPTRARLGQVFDFGVKALNMFTPACEGQRIGIFSGSGVGKSALLSMIARNAACDYSVIALIGERGREVREFIEDHLGEGGLARSVIVVATSDESALMRREAAYLAMATAEYFRDDFNGGGGSVLCLMDSLTRFAMAQREIGLASGEPPATKGFTPSVFSSLPALIERAGPSIDGRSPGYITGVYSVLVEGDDHDEPVADNARACLDGHIVLDRKIAERGRFPAVNVLRSSSRAPRHNLPKEITDLALRVRASEAIYDDMQEMVRIGAYHRGTNAEVDAAIDLHRQIESFLAQEVMVGVSADEAREILTGLLPDGREV
ncbi:MAG: FliI/YscN family ATPase [Marinicaulis sp.]|nr:FliI/YscN family ATPase [Marinicaulis sp.]